MKVLLGALAVILILILMSLFSTFLWFMIDDTLAAVTGVPAFGTLSVWFVWPTTLFIASLFKASQSCSCD